ncbi:MAG: A/G-specific adenine glycosylase, partial [Candidatus Lambdaproteobacteria bacterium]|nr:A/G-specific adenine glycosylase [Candidatus Lambdaproteobacteria bacterium]
MRDIRRRVTGWFRRHRRPLPWRDGYDPYAVWISEMMLQQTQV